jgi:hypothetical protein
MKTTSAIETRSNHSGGMSSAFDAGLLARVRKTSIILGLIVGVPIAHYFGLMAGAGWLAGTAWSLVNLTLIAAVIRRVLSDEARNTRAIVLAMAVKFPVLYGAGLVMLAVLKLPAAWLVAGFTWPLFVAVMKAAGRMFLRLDESR